MVLCGVVIIWKVFGFDHVLVWTMKLYGIFSFILYVMDLDMRKGKLWKSNIISFGMFCYIIGFGIVYFEQVFIYID